MKKIQAILMSVLSAVTAVGFAGCGGQKSDGGQTLQIYNLDNGYKSAWLETVIEEFKAQDWVKEKYPELEIILDHNTMYSEVHNQMKKGAAGNTYDLLFSAFTGGYAGTSDVLDLTEAVYDSLVPGEDVKVSQKLRENVLESCAYLDVKTGKTKYYTFTYVTGMTGIMYNEDLLNSYGISVPLTTDMFIEEIESFMKNNYSDNKYKDGISPIIACADTGYWYPMVSLWWAQYEGKEEYDNFYDGIADNREGNISVLDQGGRLAALNVMYDLFRRKTLPGVKDPVSCMNSGAMTEDPYTPQYNFLNGKGLFHCNGDYFTSEMAGQRANLPDSTIKFMKTPIISSIINRLTSIIDAAEIKYGSRSSTDCDKMLRDLIKDVDAGIVSTSVSGVTQEDYDALIEARNMVMTSSGLKGIIPSYAKGKDVAVDFLRFMATNKAYDAAAEQSFGHMLPINRNLKEDNPEIYEKMTTEQKSKFDISGEDAIMVAAADCGILGVAGLTPFKGTEDNGKIAFEIVFGRSGATKTPEEIFNADKAFWEGNRWTELCKKAGL